MTTASHDRTGFWSRPTIGKAVLLVLGYLAFYLAVGQLIGRLFGGGVDEDDPLGTAGGILLVAAPIAIGGVALALFAARQGWLAEIFGRQPVEGRRWMWIAPVLVLGAIVAHLAGVDWSRWSAGQLAALAVLGVCVGFTEELATRGFVVRMVREAGHGERLVAFLSSLLFALMHLSNLISGMSLQVVAGTVVYTFAFGMCMYLTMRVTGTIWAAIVLHGLTDPTTMLAAGGIDTAVGAAPSGSSQVALVLTTALIAFGFVAVLFVKGRGGVTTPEG
ncbi:MULTISPECIES: CPBP family intramembrane glutamic endopeptidase [unclassified Aeromicrobium]|uniref:CPBP family intramembrane glutamic endopeptidase n=1 Tax=unclassified Aeromicrobium TaxID=2633570 RepID=UPI00396B1C4C